MPWLRSGSVSCTLNSTTVTGTGTGFVANARVGDAFLGPDGRWYEVANIASDTALSILPAYLGATISAGAYALAPMQGYVKDSADQLRTLVNKFGTLAAAASINALAALTGAANKIAYFTAADQLALADFPAQARTLLAATTQALQRTALGLGSAATAAIIGTVAQASGVPTGAIIERGSNANGDYIRWADGTQICWKRVGTSSVNIASGAIFLSNTVGAGNFPAAFSALPTMTANAFVSGYAWALWASNATEPSATTWGTYYAMTPNTTNQGAYINLIAIGRWF